MGKFARMLLGACLVLVLVSGVAFAEAKYKWQFAQPWSRPMADRGYRIFCEKVKEYTNGDIEITLYTDGLLGTHDESFHGVRDGSIEIGCFSPYVNLVPGGALNWTPWTVGSFAESRKAYKVNDGVLFKIVDIAWAEVNCKLLFSCSQGSYGLGNKVRPLKKPEDLANLKMRVSSSTASVRTLQNMGSGTGMTMETIPWADLYNALSRGVVDGCWDMWVSLIDERHCEVMEHYCDLRFTWDAQNVVINKELWDSLDAKYQEAILRAAQEAQDALDDIYEAAEAEYIAKLEAMPNFHITYLTPEERAVWREKANMPAVWAEICDPWLEKHWPGQNKGAEIRAELDKIREECEREAAEKAAAKK